MTLHWGNIKEAKSPGRYFLKKIRVFFQCCTYQFCELHERSMHKIPLKEYLDWRVIVKVLTTGVELNKMYYQCIFY